jgi:hypothetical protein
MARADIADHLVHFMTGPRWVDAFGTMQRILHERQLRGSGRINRDRYRCVCFSEAPLPMVPGGPVNEDGYSRYTPFGILFDKTWVFAQGGRPVIYQPEAEYDLLPEALRWRHMRYEIGGAERVDFTWEREWRLHVDELHFDPSNAVVIVPNAEWEQRLRVAFDDQQNWQVAAYTQILDETIAEAYREDFPWRVARLGKPTPPAQ